MPFVIEWAENAVGVAESAGFVTPAGFLRLTVQGDVIIDADWSLQAIDANHAISQRLASYWQAPDSPIMVKLLKQGSDYRLRVWAALCAIPVGQTLSYAALAQQLASSPRAVGNACRDNPYPVFIPCHRIVAVSGLGGYCGQTSGSYLTIKQCLLAYEAQFKS